MRNSSLKKNYRTFTEMPFCIAVSEFLC